MANTTKTTKKPSTTKTKEAVLKEKETKTEDIKVDNEKEDLKKQIAEMKAQMELMAQMISSKKNEEIPITKKERQIRFVNLTGGELILKGSQIWKIDGMFNDRYFLEREARIIVNNMRNLISLGMVYIADSQFVEENDLSEIYLHILSDEDLKTLLQKDSSYVIEAYKTVNDGQKEIIIDMIRNELAAGHEVDGNVLVTLSKLSGKNLLSED